MQLAENHGCVGNPSNGMAWKNFIVDRRHINPSSFVRNYHSVSNK